MTIENGQVASADEVLNAIGSNTVDTVQNIFNQTYLGFDSRLTSGLGAQYKNLIYSVFESDDAISKTGFTYDGGNDRYNYLGTVGNSLIVGTDTDIGENITHIIPVINDSNIYEFSEESGIISTPGFETDIGDWGYSTGDNDATGSYSTEQAHSGTKSYKLSITEDMTTNEDHGITQSGIDLTDVPIIKFWYKKTTTTEDAACTLVVLIGGVPVSSTSFTSLVTNVWTQIEVPVSIGNRIPGQTLRLQRSWGNLLGGNSFIYFDDITTIGNKIEVFPFYSFSNDGITYESCENGKIHRPSTIGQKSLLKIEITPAGTPYTTEGGITEQAVKYNYY